jgi:drug/metabolite transporter (DMT)-like permease
MILAFFILGESISFIKILAGLLIIIGICINIINKDVKNKQEAKTDN